MLSFLLKHRGLKMKQTTVCCHTPTCSVPVEISLSIVLTNRSLLAFQI